MAERERRPTIVNPQKAFEIKTDFLRHAINNGAHLKKPPIPSLSDEGWARQKNIVGVLLGSPATESDLARQYGCTKQNIGLIFDRGMQGLWRNLDPELQKKFPLESLRGADKPVPLHVKMEVSRANGGRSWNIFQDIQNGTITKEDVRRLPEDVRRILRGWGVDIHSENYLTAKDLKDKLEKAKNYTNRQVILDGLPPNSLKKYDSKRSETVAALGPFLRSMGIHGGDYKKIINIFRRAKIPARIFEHYSPGRGSQNYHIFVRGFGYEEKARKVVEKYRLTIA